MPLLDTLPTFHPEALSCAEEARIRTHAAKLGNLPHVVSLFSGAGGLDWGFCRNGFEIALAVDKSSSAVSTHKKNLRTGEAVCADLVQIGAYGVCELLRRQIPSGTSIGVIGGPPCQGFSRANSFSRPNDPRNNLVQLYLEIIAHLGKYYKIEFIVFENVLGIKDAKHARVYGALLKGMESLRLRVTEHQLCALDFGVPQTRNRVVVAAMRSNVDPKLRRRNGFTTVREAIGHLGKPAFFEPNLLPTQIPTHPNHWTMRPKSSRFSQAPELWRSGRSFKRTFWDKPSPTIAFGHREIHVHPSCERRLSIYEAMLLQGFPANYVLQGNLSEQVEQISNAVPPPVASSVASSIRRALLGCGT